MDISYYYSVCKSLIFQRETAALHTRAVKYLIAGKRAGTRRGGAGLLDSNWRKASCREESYILD